MQYALGFRDLGWDVTFIDQLDVEAPDKVGRFTDVMRRFGLADSFCLLVGNSGRTIGLDMPDVLARAKRARLLLNIMGFLKAADILGAVPMRVFLDIDPGFPQMWCQLKLHDAFEGHDAFVTIGENIGRPGCTVPTCGRTWITMPPPISLQFWPVATDAGRTRFTSVASWRGAYGPVEYEGRTYGLRAHEFRKLVQLPARTGLPFELALDIHDADDRDRSLLESHGWTLVPPQAVAGDLEAYRRYIQRSFAEFMVAKNMYVQSNSGWISDRSLCYLASGRPVLAHDTGFDARYRTGAGLLPFSTLEEAADGAAAIAADYERHRHAARQLAEAEFDARRVLARLVRQLES